jgi:hypothetical protein
MGTLRCFKGGRLVAGLVLLHAIDDSHPDVGQGTHHHTVALALCPFPLVVLPLLQVLSSKPSVEVMPIQLS